MMMKRALVTGGTGFVGANLVRRLLRDGHDVHLLVRPEHKSWRIDEILRDIRIHIVPMLDPDALSAVVADIHPEWVFHLAVHGGYSWQTDIRRIINTNILGTVNLVEACLSTGFEAFINTGSSSEYGFKDHPPTETEWLDPNSNYAVSKAAATLFCRHTARERNVHMVTLRLSSAYGPYEEPARLLPTVIVKGLNNELPLLVDPEIARDLIHVDDVVDAYLMAASAGGLERGSVFNVGTSVQTTIRGIIDIARRILEIEPEPEWGTMPDRRWDTKTWVSDNRRITEQLGWNPNYAFEAGFSNTVDWFRKSPDITTFYRESQNAHVVPS